MNKSISLIFFILLILLLSCRDDCEIKEVEVAEWRIRYENYTQDTLVHYSVAENKVSLTEFPTSNDLIEHSVTIRNNNATYANSFAVVIDYRYYDSYRNHSKEFSYVRIPPQSSHTFRYSCRGAKTKEDFSNFTASVRILQKPLQITLQRRIDDLHLSTIELNSCKKNIEAEEAKYNAIKELYMSKIDSNSTKIIIN